MLFKEAFGFKQFSSLYSKSVRMPAALKVKVGAGFAEVIWDEVMTAIEEVEPNLAPRIDADVVRVAVPFVNLRLGHSAMRTALRGLGRFVLRLRLLWLARRNSGCKPTER